VLDHLDVIGPGMAWAVQALPRKNQPVGRFTVRAELIYIEPIAEIIFDLWHGGSSFILKIA
jgi:hypothetical protein